MRTVMTTVTTTDDKGEQTERRFTTHNNATTADDGMALEIAWYSETWPETIDRTRYGVVYQMAS